MRVPAHLGYRRRKPKALTTILATAVRLLVAVAVVYLLVTGFVVTSVRELSASMEPTLEQRDLLLVSPLIWGPRVPFTGLRIPGLRAPERGELVLLATPQDERTSLARRLLDVAVRFLTLQRATVSGLDADDRPPRLTVKRIIGVPGDTVRMAGYRAEVRPAGATEFAAEPSLSRRSYEPRIGAELPDATPFGGSLPEVVLGEGEYFVLGDNRGDSSDSRSWGAVRMERFVGVVIWRYFPLRRFGRP